VPDGAKPGDEEQELAPENAPPRADDPEAPAGNHEPAKPLTLDEAIALAFQYQPRLRIFQESIEQARGRGESAFAPFLPQLTAYTRAFTAHDPSGPEGGVPLPALELGTARGSQNFVVQELLLQWTLWDFGRTYGRYQQAALGIDIAQLQTIRVSQTVAFEVATAYFRLLQARATRVVAQESVRRAESILDITRKSFKAGLVERDQVLRAEVQLAQERRAVVTSQRAVLVAGAALNLAIGLNVSLPTEVVDRTDEPPFGLSLAECLQRAVENRREFRVAQRSIEVAQEGVRVARADFAPQVFAQGAAAYSGGHKVLVGPTESGSIIINWNLLQGGQRQGQLRTANAALRAAAAQAQVVCDTIAYEVNEAYRDLDAARQNIALARPAVTQARENLRLVTRKYQAGDATPTDIVDAETALTRAQQDYYNSLYDYLTALARIEYAMGVTPFRGSPPAPH
jgi:outer membrane protein TolC